MKPLHPVRLVIEINLTGLRLRHHTMQLKAAAEQMVCILQLEGFTAINARDCDVTIPSAGQSSGHLDEAPEAPQQV